MDLEIRLLGTVELLREGQPVALRGVSTRTLLAYLALHPGRAHPVDGIVDALWEESAPMPQNPRDAVHTYASRLRTALGPGSVIGGRSGYRLGVADTHVDAHRFTALLHDAGDPACSSERRIELLTAARGLWRGPALDGLRGLTWAAAEATRLDELVADAVDLWADAQFALGRARDTVADLESAVRARPLRERTHAQLMRALYACGRQGEALRVFSAFRDRLGDELGLSPSSSLVGLDRAIAGERVDPLLSAEVRRGWEIHERVSSSNDSPVVVYRGTQCGVGRPVAVRVVGAAIADRPTFVREFESAMSSVVSIDHPHMATVLDHWREPGSARVVTQWYGGGSLAARLARLPLSDAEVGRLIRQIGSALGALHRQHLCHGEVAAHHVYLDEDVNFFLGGFGVPSVDAAGGAPGDVAGDANGSEIAGRTRDLLAFLDLIEAAATNPVEQADGAHTVAVALDELRARCRDPRTSVDDLVPRAY